MSIKNHVIPAKTWTDLNTVTTTAVGANVSISNLGRADIRIIQQPTQPSAVVGDIITPNTKPYARAVVTGGAKIWVYSEFPCEVAVQELP
jgi:hypothetical protein